MSDPAPEPAAQTAALSVAIIGFGPRGLAAAEFVLTEQREAQIDIFDPGQWPAAGPNFSPEETQCCLLNLRAGEIDLPEFALCEFPSFNDWLRQTLGQTPAPDFYPPRQMLGQYLHQRYLALTQACPGAVTHHREIATAAWRDAAGWWVGTHMGQYGPYEEVVMAMGQPTTRPDPTLERWRSLAAEYGATIAAAYPGHVLQDMARDWRGKTVAVRGLGLAALDVVAVLTLGQGGRMVDGGYLRSGREPAAILPFSLDGMPPLPKPIAAAEKRFALTGEEQSALRAGLERAMSRAPDQAMAIIREALVPPARRLSGADPIDWLVTECDSPGAQDASRAPVDVLREGIDMAVGGKPPSVGYAIGQIWRAIQTDLREVFLAQEGRPDTRAAILDFDRGLKRMTYGPPLRSAQLMLALIEEGVVRLTVADDPKIELSGSGWLMDGKAHAQVMVDAVLPAAKLEQIEEPVIRSLQREGVLHEFEPVGSIEVDATGQAAPGLSVLGRLTEGRSIASDSIHDCFGDMTRGWAHALQGQRSARPESVADA